MTTVIRGTDNSVSAPAVSGSDGDTGVYFPAANQVALATNGTQGILVDENQAVRINGASASTSDSKLNTLVNSAGSLVTLAEFRNADYTAGTLSTVRVRGNINVGSTYSSYFGQGQDGKTYIIANNSARGGDIVIDGGNGNVFINGVVNLDSNKFNVSGAKTLSSGIPQAQLAVGDTTTLNTGTGGAISFLAKYNANDLTTMGSIEGVRENATSGNYAGTLVFKTRTNGSDNFERARISSDGNLRVGMQNYAAQPSSTNYGVSINNTSTGSRFYGQGTGTETQIEFGNTNGLRGSIQTNSTNTLYNTTSDYRLKENVVPMVNALATVSALKPCTYTWKVDGSAGQGFIAHELAEVVPDCVTGEKDAVDEDGNIKPQFVDTSFLVATLTAAIQELKAITDAQATRIEALEAEVAALKGAN